MGHIFCPVNNTLHQLCETLTLDWTKAESAFCRFAPLFNIGRFLNIDDVNGAGIRFSLKFDDALHLVD